MARKVIYLILPLILLAFVSTVNAENTTTTSAKATTEATTKLRQQMQLIQEQKRAAISSSSSGIKTLIQIKRGEFEASILKIKDQKKKALVEKIDAKITEVNKNQTSRFLEILATLQGFLDKIKQSTTDTKVSENVTAAQFAINLARNSVNIQATKAYPMEITDDVTLRSNAEKIVSQFRQDITTVYKFVVDAKQAVQKSNVERNLIKKEATSSANL
jgi:hypothetical protein